MSEKKMKSHYTEVIHGGQEHDPLYGAISVPIYQSSTFIFKNAEQGAARFAGEENGYIYTRLGNPTTRALEDNIAFLEKGYGGLATSSGMSAWTTLIMTFMEKDTHMICTDAVYGMSRIVVETLFENFGIESDFVDTSSIESIQACLKPNTRLLMVETPANPTMKLSDIEACSQLAKDNDLIFIVDNTFASPVLQNPLKLGADIVYHSVTKFINGHSDVVGGIIIPLTKELYDRIYKVLTLMGGTMDPHQAWLVLRGTKTLALRVEKGQETAIKLAHYLKNHPDIAWVDYPGLESHPQYSLAKKQMRGFGSLISFGLKGGYETGKKMMDAVRLCSLAVSLGGIETLIQHPASMTHAKVPIESRQKAGISDDMIRLSIGAEGYDDIKDDLEQAILKAK
ncbi:trans-sulfuration enzyme family protein [Acidobacteriota bacterium]